MSHQPRGVIGIGQTKHSKARADVSIPGLVPRGRRAAPSTTPA